MTAFEARSLIETVMIQGGRKAILTNSRNETESARLQLTRLRAQLSLSLPVLQRLKISTQSLGNNKSLVYVELINEAVAPMQIFDVNEDGSLAPCTTIMPKAEPMQASNGTSYDSEMSKFNVSEMFKDTNRRLVSVWLQDHPEGTFEDMMKDLGVQTSETDKVVLYQELWDSLA